MSRAVAIVLTPDQIDAIANAVVEKIAASNPVWSRNKAPKFERLLSPKEIAERRGCDVATVFRAIKSGKLASQKIGGARRSTETQVAAYLAGQPP